MLGNHGRSITKAIFTPVARVLVAAHITPNMVTIAGTVVTIAVAVTTFPFGYLWQGALALAVVLFCDSIDGVLARMSGTSSPFGAFLDSTMDRLGDGAVFGSLTAFAIFSMESSPSRTVSIVQALLRSLVLLPCPIREHELNQLGLSQRSVLLSGRTVSSLLCWELHYTGGAHPQ